MLSLVRDLFKPSFSQASSKRRPIIQATGPPPVMRAAEGRIVILSAAGLADELEDVAIPIGKIRHQPFAEQIAHLEWKPQQHVAGLG